MAENGTPPDLSERLAALEGDVASLQSTAAVADEGVVYRPPLWSQNAAYSAADDRRLITAALYPGVLTDNDLKVTQRAEGASMSVDVAPGMVVIPGTEQADQGNYLCPLAQRVNIPIPAGPSAGNHRRDYIYARVYEPGGEEEPAYWQVEVVTGPIGPVNQEAPHIGIAPFPDHPPSSTLLAVIETVQSGTTSITDPMIRDFREWTRPVSRAQFVVRSLNLGPQVGEPTAKRWGPTIHLYDPPRGGLIDVEVRVEGSVGAAWVGEGQVRAWLWLDLQAVQGVHSHTLVAGTQGAQPGLVYASQGSLRWMARSVYTVVAADYPDILWAAAFIQSEWDEVRPPALFEQGTLTMRITPSLGYPTRS